MTIQIAKSVEGSGFVVAWVDVQEFLHIRTFARRRDAENFRQRLMCRRNIELLLHDLKYFSGLRTNAILREETR